MKDSHLGTYGITAIFFILTARILFTGRCLQNYQLELIAFSPLFSRTVQAWGCSLLPYARTSEENGTAEKFISGRKPIALFLITLGGTIAVTVIWGTEYFIILTLIICIPSLLFFIYCFHRIGGITGDCLGAVNEIAEVSVLVVGCMIYRIV